MGKYLLLRAGFTLRFLEAWQAAAICDVADTNYNTNATLQAGIKYYAEESEALSLLLHHLVAYPQKHFSEPFLHCGSLLLFLQIWKLTARLKRSGRDYQPASIL